MSRIHSTSLSGVDGDRNERKVVHQHFEPLGVELVQAAEALGAA